MEVDEWTNNRSKFPKLEVKMNEQLEEELSCVENHKALFVMVPWKSLSSNGFPAGFFQNSWSMVGNKVGNYVKELYRHLRNIIEVNQTDLCLIHKVNNLQLVTQLCPITLCITLYNLLSKFIA